jgi:RNA polymerase subunit RPABC4/transcription elongation factor Spt4
MEEKKSDKELEKIENNKIRGRVIIINPDKSEFAKNLGLTEKGDYFKKK